MKYNVHYKQCVYICGVLVALWYFLFFLGGGLFMGQYIIHNFSVTFFSAIFPKKDLKDAIKMHVVNLLK